MHNTVKIRKLEWLSDFFGLNCGEVISPSKLMVIDEKDLSYYHFLQGKCLDRDMPSKCWFEKNRFFFEDSRLTFQKDIEKRSDIFFENIHIAIATMAESDSIENIAKNVMAEHSRFMNLVGEEKTKEFYATWVKNAIISDFDHICFYASIDNRISGFITLRFVENAKAIIGLIGVEREYWGKRIAKSLIQYSENFLFQKGFTSLEVATEGRNDRAIRFYNNYGFNLKDTEYWYYKILKERTS